MRIVKSGEIKKTCKRCNSLIAMFPHEISVIGPLGPYDMDDSDDVGKKYWKCPACRYTNYISPPKEDY